MRKNIYKYQSFYGKCGNIIPKTSHKFWNLNCVLALQMTCGKLFFFHKINNWQHLPKPYRFMANEEGDWGGMGWGGEMGSISLEWLSMNVFHLVTFHWKSNSQLFPENASITKLNRSCHRHSLCNEKYASDWVQSWDDGELGQWLAVRSFPGVELLLLCHYLRTH